MQCYVRKPTPNESAEHKNKLIAVYVEEPDEEAKIFAPPGTLTQNIYPIYMGSLLHNGYMPDLNGARLYAFENLSTVTHEICQATDIGIR